MKQKANKRGIVLIIIGVLLLVTAVVWFGANIAEDKAAGEHASVILDELIKQTEENKKRYNEFQYPEESLGSISDSIAESQTESALTPEAIYTDPPLITINGENFCGRIVIDRLGIALPVFNEWDYKKLKEAPCRYTGGVYTDDMIIAAHNYESHFGNLKELQIGDKITFIDGIGREYTYAVREITHLDGTAVTDMQSGEWDFTLFTCTKGGAQRITVRCERIS